AHSEYGDEQRHVDHAGDDDPVEDGRQQARSSPGEAVAVIGISHIANDAARRRVRIARTHAPPNRGPNPAAILAHLEPGFAWALPMPDHATGRYHGQPRKKGNPADHGERRSGARRRQSRATAPAG